MKKENTDSQCNEIMHVPKWIDQDITFGQVQSIVEGGCSSGAYMPAVTYYDARQTMAKHGDDVMDYISETGIEIGYSVTDKTWSEVCCYLLSSAVELWAMEANDKIEEIEEEESEESDEID